MAPLDLTLEERVRFLEERLANYDTLIGKLIAYARLTKAGRVMLRGLGL